MPYIYLDDQNCYRPSEDLQGLFEELIIRPYEERLVIPPDDIVSYSSGILERGRINFDMSTLYHEHSYSPEEKVILYCCTYMPMHLYSSYHLYSMPLIPLIKCENILFIDFGCGPLTSGIAFWAATKQPNITYIGIDSSQTMLNKAQEINQYGADRDSREPFYKNFHLIRNYNQLSKLLEDIRIENPDETLTIFNFCYFLQSKTLEIVDLESLAEVLYFADVGGYTCMVYQDPVSKSFQDKWYNFKRWVITYHSQFNESGFGWQDPTQEMSVKYERLRIFPTSTHTVDVSYDSFNNFSYYRRTIHDPDR